MIIDGHANACGVYSNVNSIKIQLEINGVDKVILCGG